jgi:hypothetical protein
VLSAAIGGAGMHPLVMDLDDATLQYHLTNLARRLFQLPEPGSAPPAAPPSRRQTGYFVGQCVTPATRPSRALAIVAGGGSVDAVAGRLGSLMLKDVTVVREVAQSAGADLGIIGTVLSSDAVEKKVLHPASAPDRAS